MEIVIFGATGHVGRYLVRQALLKNYKVRAFGRNVHQLPDNNPNLQLIHGGVFDEQQVHDAIKGCAGVLSVLGGSFDGMDKTRSLGIKNITTQMKKSGVKRIVALGNRSVLDSPEGGLILDEDDFPEEYVPVGREHKKAWEYLKASGLEWTFVCSPDIINAEPVGNFLTRANEEPSGVEPKINAGDLALFMLRELESNEYLEQRVGIGTIES